MFSGLEKTWLPKDTPGWPPLIGLRGQPPLCPQRQTLLPSGLALFALIRCVCPLPNPDWILVTYTHSRSTVSCRCCLAFPSCPDFFCCGYSIRQPRRGIGSFLQGSPMGVAWGTCITAMTARSSSTALSFVLLTDFSGPCGAGDGVSEAPEAPGGLCPQVRQGPGLARPQRDHRDQERQLSCVSLPFPACVCVIWAAPPIHTSPDLPSQAEAVQTPDRADQPPPLPSGFPHGLFSLSLPLPRVLLLSVSQARTFAS